MLVFITNIELIILSPRAYANTGFAVIVYRIIFVDKLNNK